MKYDVAIIGAGPAGMTASIFAVRGGLRTACFEKMAVGGNMTLAYEVNNFPGIKSTTGFDLATEMEEHAKSAGVEFKYEKVLSLKKTKSGFSLKTKNNEYEAKKVIICSGSKTRKLDLENENKFIGRGVSYCASCDGNFYKDKTVAVVGGGYTSLGDVIYLSNLAKKVYLINRSEKFRFPQVKLNQLKSKPNVEIITNSNVVDIQGKEKLEKILVSKNGKTFSIEIDGLFIAIGQDPDLGFIELDLNLDDQGYIKVNKKQQTNIKNLYACGDATNSGLKQIITACAQGAIAANNCIED